MSTKSKVSTRTEKEEPELPPISPDFIQENQLFSKTLHEENKKGGP